MYFKNFYEILKPGKNKNKQLAMLIFVFTYQIIFIAKKSLLNSGFSQTRVHFA